jgi:hypothetical protein
MVRAQLAVILPHTPQERRVDERVEAIGFLA